MYERVLVTHKVVDGNISSPLGSMLEAPFIGVAAGSTGRMGGNHTHGGESVLEITDLASGALWVSINGGPYRDVQSVRIGVGGDGEVEDLLEGLQHAVKTLEAARDGFFPAPPAKK